MLPLTLRPRAVRQLVHVLIDGPAGYRTGHDLEAYFARLGDHHARQTDSRIAYATRVLEHVQARGGLIPFLAQVVQIEPSAGVREQLQVALSEVLSPYGLRLDVQPDTGVVEVVPRVTHTEPPTPAVLSMPTFQGADLSPEEITLLQDRWREAVAMFHTGALRMTILALSALLEHVLMARALRQPDEARASPLAPAAHLPIRDWTFDTRLAVAAERGWIHLQREDVPYRVRHYRAFLSPARELQEGPWLDEALMHETWWTIRRALDDVAGSSA